MVFEHVNVIDALSSTPSLDPTVVVTNGKITGVAVGLERCPFLALSAHQRAANGGKRRHKPKVENQRILRVMAQRSVSSSTAPQRQAHVSFSASPETARKD
jgi:hypothetical protein